MKTKALSVTEVSSRLQAKINRRDANGKLFLCSSAPITSENKWNADEVVYQEYSNGYSRVFLYRKGEPSPKTGYVPSICVATYRDMKAADKHEFVELLIKEGLL